MRVLLKTCFVLQFVLTMITSSSQSTAIHPDLIGLHFNENGFNSKRISGSAPGYDAGFSISYLRGWRPHFDLHFQLNGSFPNAISNRQLAATRERAYFFQSELSIRSRPLLPSKQWQPFLQTGIGAGLFRNAVPVYALFGPGLEINCRRFFVNLTAQYRPRLNRVTSPHFFYSIGIAGLIAKKKRPIAPAPVISVDPLPPLSDRDGDGITDNQDLCPDIPGLLRFNGCPDTDDDGIEDRKDSCVNTPGLERYNGCPIPDSDHDGFNDEVDSCVLIPGVAQLHGCPLTTSILKDSLNIMARHILFENASYILLPSSFDVLQNITEILLKNDTINVIVEGHTDNNGSSKANQTLSEHRAETVVAYLISRGVPADRLQSKGFGEEHPIADNSTVEGRALNRRVVFVLH